MPYAQLAALWAHSRAATDAAVRESAPRWQLALLLENEQAIEAELRLRAEEYEPFAELA